MAALHAIGYANFYCRSHSAVIRVYNESGNVIETHEYEEGCVSSSRSSKYSAQFGETLPFPFRITQLDGLIELEGGPNRLRARGCNEMITVPIKITLPLGPRRPMVLPQPQNPALIRFGCPKCSQHLSATCAQNQHDRTVPNVQRSDARVRIPPSLVPRCHAVNVPK